jgi:hypothetical protein
MDKITEIIDTKLQKNGGFNKRLYYIFFCWPTIFSLPFPWSTNEAQ